MVTADAEGSKKTELFPRKAFHPAMEPAAAEVAARSRAAPRSALGARFDTVSYSDFAFLSKFHRYSPTCNG